MNLKEVGDGQKHSYRGFWFSGLAATLMATVPEAIPSLMLTAFGDDIASDQNPLAYVNGGDDLAAFRSVMTVVSFIGYCFFIRGVWILKEAGEPQRHSQSTTGKAIVTLGAGMFAIYIDSTLGVLANTLGWDISRYISST